MTSSHEITTRGIQKYNQSHRKYSILLDFSQNIFTTTFPNPFFSLSRSFTDPICVRNKNFQPPLPLLSIAGICN